MKIKFPKLKMIKDLEEVAKKIIVPDIVGQIDKGESIDRVEYPPLATSTIARKEGIQKTTIKSGKSAGRVRKYKGTPAISQKALIHTGKLRKGIKINSNKKDTVKIFITSADKRNKVAKHLQVNGVKSKKFGKRYFNFFGISSVAEKLAVDHVEKKIRKLVRA